MANKKLSIRIRPADRQPIVSGLVVGLTGGIASGKSTVAQMLKTKGAHIIDLDQIGHQLLRADSPVINRLIETFGGDILEESGDVSRTKLGEIVFANPTDRQQLDAIMHPRIHQISRQSARNLARADPDSVVVIDSPLLIESGGYRSVDYIVVVVSNQSQQVDRLIQRSKSQRRPLNQLQAKARIEAQMPVSEKIAYADYAVHNDGTLSDLKDQVHQLWDVLKG